MVAKISQKADDELQALRHKEEEDLIQIMARRRRMQYLDLGRTTIDIDSLKIIPEADAQAYQIAVIQSVGKKLRAVVTNPERKGVAEILDGLKRKKYEVTLFLVSSTGFQKVLLKYKEVPKFEELKAGLLEILPPKIEGFGDAIKSVFKLKAAVETLARESESKKATEAMELLFAGALNIESSDVHIEPREASAIIRLRIDGVLQDLAEIMLPLYSLLLSRIKLVSEIKLNVQDRPQDGRFTIRIKEDIEVRTSTLPGPYGESIVMRLLLPQTISITFEKLGMQPPLFEMMKKELDRPNGMILNTGPTGSGKTTTLYAFLKTISSPEYKMITIEDPIEYKLKNVTQTQVDKAKGYDFSNGLRSILRQDPDIILVGEIRDLETAEIAMHASLTGHLVFSTLHTNDAAGTVPRLIDLGVKNNIISPALNIVMAQRLVRILCVKCKKERAPTKEEEKIISQSFALVPPAYKPYIPQKISIFDSVGCEICHNTGFKGRIGIFEAFLVDDEMERLIIKNPPQADVERAARKQGMLTMHQDGIMKVASGTTSFEELNRVVSG